GGLWPALAGAMGARASATIPVTPASDWAPYVAASGIVGVSEDEAIVHFIADALQSTPLPSPWKIGDCESGAEGRAIFLRSHCGVQARCLGMLVPGGERLFT
ncbi:unnamed protein product, partial [Prorocentrum cordatum]